MYNVGFFAGFDSVSKCWSEYCFLWTFARKIMVVIRLSRAGTKKRPFYHVVVTDKRRRRDSNSIESVGYFNPIAKGQDVRLHLDVKKIDYWKGVGAQLSDRVSHLYAEFAKNANSVNCVADAKQ